MAGMLQMRRSRGAFSGFLLVLLGLWGALVPFIGPYFHYAYTPDVAWHYDTARLWLQILPGAAVVLGGLMLMVSTGRHTALFGGLLAAASGAWFVLGTTLSLLWNNYVPLGGSPASSQPFMRVMEQLGFFYALGVVIVLIAGVAHRPDPVRAVRDQARSSRSLRSSPSGRRRSSGFPLTRSRWPGSGPTPPRSSGSRPSRPGSRRSRATPPRRARPGRRPRRPRTSGLRRCGPSRCRGGTFPPRTRRPSANRATILSQT